jgi:two-component system sensor histidine kinase KdpD
MSYFFLAPLHDPWVSDPQHIGALAVFLLVSAVGSSLLATSRAHAEEAEQGRAQAEALLQLNRAMIGQPDPSAALQALCERLRGTFELRGAAVLVRHADAWAVVAATEGDARRELTREESLLADAAVSHSPKDASPKAARRRRIREVAPRGSVLRTRITMLPLRAGSVCLGVLRLDGADAEPYKRLSPQLLDAFVGEAALALQRLELARSAGQAEALRRADEVKTAILSSIAHDLKTPLATIKTSTSSLLDESVPWSSGDRRAFLESIGAETDRLDKTISALLDLNRLESGAVHPLLRPEALDQLVEEAMELACGTLKTRRVWVDVAPISVRTDGSLIRHALANLLENAALYSIQEGEIRVRATLAEGSVRLAVEDDGPGIAKEHLPYVFHRFYKARSGHGASRGNGLGLAIVKGFVTACGGSIEVESSPEGTCFMICLPLSEVSVR